MPPVTVIHLSDLERDALAAARERFGTYADVAAELGLKSRQVESYFQRTNRSAIPERRLERFLHVVLQARPEEADRLRWVLRDAARDVLQAAEAAVERERMAEALERHAGLTRERPPVGADAARGAGHIGVAKSAAA